MTTPRNPEKPDPAGPAGRLGQVPKEGRVALCAWLARARSSAAQALVAGGPGDTVIVATDNVGHFGRLVDARHWGKIATCSVARPVFRWQSCHFTRRMPMTAPQRGIPDE